MGRWLMGALLLSTAPGIAVASPADPEWEEATRGRLLALGDADGSGSLEVGEIALVPCESWAALDAEVRGGWGHTTAEVYGLDGKGAWLGDRLGIERSAARRATSTLRRCVREVPIEVSEPPSGGALAMAILAIEGPGTDGWDRSVRTLLLDAYDRDGSGELAEGEVDEVSCLAWLAVDRGVLRRFGVGVWRTYGFEATGTWVGDVLGFAREDRRRASAALAACGLGGRYQDRLGVLGDRNGALWDEVVRGLVLEHWDRDRSGAVDSDAEVEAVGCDFWRTVDAAADGVVETWGIAPESAWHADDIGFGLSARDDMMRALDRCGVIELAEPEAVVLSIDERIARATGAGSTDWDETVRVALLEAFDADTSGTLDTVAEVEAIPCSTWSAMDKPIRRGWRAGVHVVYGFAPGNLWSGQLLGFSEAVRAPAAARIAACVQTGGEEVDRDLLERLQGVPDPASASWEAVVRGLLTERYDGDGDGALDQAEELDAVGCEVWRALERRVRTVWPDGFFVTYGFDPAEVWLGASLGIADAGREAAARRLEACELAPPRPPHAPDEMGRALRALAEPGSEAWERGASAALVARYDQDRSRFVDTPSEALSLPCDTWEAIDEGIRASWKGGAYRILGFDPETSWAGWRMGFGEGAREEGARQLRACGLADESGFAITRSAADVATIEAMALIPSPGSSAWDDEVKALLLTAYDRDGSGTLDLSRELRAVGCPVWTAVDEAVRTAWEDGLLFTYGFEADARWVGGALGLDEGLRDEARAQIGACLAPR